MADEKDWGAKLAAWIARRPIVTALLAVVVVVSAVLSLTGWIAAGYVKLDQTLRWRAHEYHGLSELRAGFHIAVFEEALGAALFQRSNPDGTKVEYTFRGREHWIQVVTDQRGSSLLYAVTSCVEKFRPSFELPNGSFVTLNRDTLASVELAHEPQLDFFVSGATANSRFIESHYGGNPTNYQTYIVGVNDVCFSPGEMDEWYESGLVLFDELEDPWRYSGVHSQAPRSVLALREAIRVNTFGETAIHVGYADLEDFQVGVDRILVRGLTSLD